MSKTDATRWRPVSPDGWLVFFLSALLVTASWTGWLKVDPAEAAGFATGAVCVWLTTRGSIWNFPIGIANNLVFALLFWNARLFGSFGLQWVYIILTACGWYHWLHGGEQRGRKPVTRVTPAGWAGIAMFTIPATWVLHRLLQSAGGEATLADAATTALSLSAQYLLSLRKLENWYVWILADLIFIPLHIHRGLPLTAALYAAFLLLCIAGIWRWKKELREA